VPTPGPRSPYELRPYRSALFVPFLALVRPRRRRRSGRAGVVELDVVEGDQVVLDKGQGGEALRGVARAGVVEQQDRPAAVRLEEHVTDQALRAQLGDPAALRRQMRGDVLAGQVTDDQNLHLMPSFAVAGCGATAACAPCTSGRKLVWVGPSRLGNHKFARPISCSTAGMSTMRTTVASSTTATAMPSPMTRSTRRSPSTNAAKTQI